MKLDFQDLKRQLTSNEASHFIQFCKYGTVGVVATAINTILIFIAAWKLWPALTPDEPGWVLALFSLESADIAVIEESLRQVNYIKCSFFAFMISNAICYVMNVLWVFRPGRHSRWVELGLFYLVSGFATGVGVGAATWLVSYGWTTTAIVGVNILISVTINYFLRKFAVFDG